MRYGCGIGRALAIRCINLYQRTLSPDHGWCRRFFPDGCCAHRETCSDYGKRVIAERGVGRGAIMLARRVWSCR